MDAKGHLLIVDDDQDVLDALKLFLKYEFEKVETCSNPNLIPSLLANGDFDLVLLDMNFTDRTNSGNEGIFWLHEIRKMPDPPEVIPITAFGEVNIAVRAIREGAVDFVVKPWDNDKLTSTLKAALKLRYSKIEISQLKRKQNQLFQDLGSSPAIYRGNSKVMERVYSMIGKIAGTDANILLTGENGTGKEIIAREIHRLSQGKAGPFISVDLGALNENIFESELFGHVRGAFTDAREDRTGRFEMAEGGTLHLDEISNVPLYLQTKLLSAIQFKEISRLGSSEKISLDTRIIASTNKDLQQMVRDGLFREDLLYRINTVEVQIPPLRERGNEILFLADRFLQEYSSKYSKPGMRLNLQAQTKLQQHSWPGNVRELRHTIEKTVILGEKEILGPEDILLASGAGIRDASDELLSLEELEKDAIGRALDKYSGNISLTASKLGISRPTLYKKIHKYGLRT